MLDISVNRLIPHKLVSHNDGMSNAQESIQTPTVQLRHRLAISMEWAGVRRTDMAELLAVSNNTISNYTNGKTTPSRGVVIAWALRCGVPVEWLYDGEVDHSGDPDNRGVATSTKWSRSHDGSLPKATPLFADLDSLPLSA